MTPESLPACLPAGRQAETLAPEIGAAVSAAAALVCRKPGWKPSEDDTRGALGAHVAALVAGGRAVAPADITAAAAGYVEKGRRASLPALLRFIEQAAGDAAAAAGAAPRNGEARPAGRRAAEAVARVEAIEAKVRRARKEAGHAE